MTGYTPTPQKWAFTINAVVNRSGARWLIDFTSTLILKSSVTEQPCERW